jgi:hypothetical protein
MKYQRAMSIWISLLVSALLLHELVLLSQAPAASVRLFAIAVDS